MLSQSFKSSAFNTFCKYTVLTIFSFRRIFQCTNMGSRKRSISHDADMLALHKEWDEALCPICMDHPHNAVLLLCSSHDKGCRSYICDTSYRHSNCLDRYRKLKDENSESQATVSSNPRNHHDSDNASNVIWSLGRSGGHTQIQGTHNPIDVNSTSTEGSGRGRTQGAYARDVHIGILEEGVGHPASASLSGILGPEGSNIGNSSMSSLRCPMCRGSVLGWKVVEEGRRHLNSKPRSCSRESCSFSGNYGELRRHARRVHPGARPANVDESRQRAWRRLENQREYDDIVSAIRSAMPGAVVLGDYVIENGDRLSGDRERVPGESGRLLSTFFLFQMIDSMDSAAEPRGGRSRALSRHRRSAGGFSRRRYLWGENLLGLQEDDTDEEEDLGIDASSDSGEGALLNARRQRRRRFMHSGENEDQQ